MTIAIANANPVPTTKPTAPVPKQMSQTREDSVYLAKLAEQAERYEGE